MLNQDYITYPYKTIENLPFFSQVLEMRITSINSHRHKKFDYNLEQLMPMCER